MASHNLPTTIAADGFGQIAHTNAVHSVVNWFDKDAVPAAGQLLTWDATAGLYVPAPVDPVAVTDVVIAAVKPGAGISVTPLADGSGVTISANLGAVVYGGDATTLGG